MGNQCCRPRRLISLAAGLLGTLLASSLTTPGMLIAQATALKSPPIAAVRPVTEDFFGVKVLDRYRYMEDLASPEVASWFKAQNDYARAVLARIPGRRELLARVKLLDDSVPARIFDVRRFPGEVYFYQKQLPKEEVARLYTRTHLNGAERLLVDPTKYQTPGGPHYSINYYAPSFDGAYVAYGVSPGGSEDAVLHIIETATGRECKETIDRTAFGFPAWLPDGRRFFYTRLQKTDPKAVADRFLKSRVYLHVVGTDPQQDFAVLGSGVRSGPKIADFDYPGGQTMPGSTEVFGVVVPGIQNEIVLYAMSAASLQSGDFSWRKICDVEDEVITFAAHGDDLYLLTHRDAPRYKLIRTSLSRPDLAHALEVVPQSRQVILDIAESQDGLYLQMLDAGIGRLVRVPFETGRPEEVKLPYDGAISIKLTSHEFPIMTTDARVPGLLLQMGSWTKAARICAYDPATGQISDTRLQPLGPFDDPADFVSEEVKVSSYDRTLVPLSIVHRRGLKLDGTHPTLLSAYGGLRALLDPLIIPFLGPRAWLDQGGVCAVAHVRGGGENGEEWHRAGMKLTKPNTWRNFIACAEYLIDKKYTSAARLAGLGASPEESPSAAP